MSLPSSQIWCCKSWGKCEYHGFFKRRFLIWKFMCFLSEFRDLSYEFTVSSKIERFQSLNWSKRRERCSKRRRPQKKTLEIGKIEGWKIYIDHAGITANFEIYFGPVFEILGNNNLFVVSRFVWPEHSDILTTRNVRSGMSRTLWVLSSAKLQIDWSSFLLILKGNNDHSHAITLVISSLEIKAMELVIIWYQTNQKDGITEIEIFSSFERQK